MTTNNNTNNAPTTVTIEGNLKAFVHCTKEGKSFVVVKIATKNENENKWSDMGDVAQGSKVMELVGDLMAKEPKLDYKGRPYWSTGVKVKGEWKTSPSGKQLLWVNELGRYTPEWKTKVNEALRRLGLTPEE